MTTATERPLRIAVIVGSTREGRFGPTIADWFVRRARRRDGLHTDIVDARDTEHAGALAEADGFVVVTPEYNHSYPGDLKNLIDSHDKEWHAKPVAFVAYGGLSGGLRAVEHLRPVFAELHAVTVRDTVSFHNPWGRFDDTGELIEPAAAETAAETLLDQLIWWAETLRDARATRPYGK